MATWTSGKPCKPTSLLLILVTIRNSNLWATKLFSNKCYTFKFWIRLLWTFTLKSQYKICTLMMYYFTQLHNSDFFWSGNSCRLKNLTIHYIFTHWNSKHCATSANVVSGHTHEQINPPWTKGNHVIRPISTPVTLMATAWRSLWSTTAVLNEHLF